MPPTKTDETYAPRNWACDECRTVLGVVMRDTMRLRHLWVFAIGKCAENVPAERILRSAPRGLYKVHRVDSATIECSHCGALNEWTPAKESFNKLIERYAKAG